MNAKDLQGKQFYTTGDISLGAALNAVGVPPRGLRPVKRGDGRDFFRLKLGPETIDGQHRTVELMRRWGRGAAGVRQAPSSPWAALQCWSKTRSAMVRGLHGEPLYAVRCGGVPVLVTGPDMPEWHDGGEPPRVLQAKAGVACEVGLAAALVTLGVAPLGFSAGHGAIFAGVLEWGNPEAAELAQGWPEMLGNRDVVGSYLAAAEQARTLIGKAIRENAPDIYLENGKATATLDAQMIEERDPRAEEVLRRIGA